jgi:hypothetical protein
VWLKKTVASLSDTLGPGEWIKQCPKCGSEVLTMRDAGWLDEEGESGLVSFDLVGSKITLRDRIFASDSASV